MKYRRKPLIVEAIKFEGTDFNIDMLTDMIGIPLTISYADPIVPILILNGTKKVCAPKGYYIAKTTVGEILAIPPYEFERDYERIEE